MRNSKALGLWAKHCWIMELLDEESDDGIPPELVRLRDREDTHALIDEVLAAGHEDAEWLLDSVQGDAELAFTGEGSPFKASRRRTRSAWSTLSYLRTTPNGQPLHLGAYLSAIDGVHLTLQLWLWGKGGEATERVFVEHLASVTSARESEGTGWGRGTVLLSNIRLSRREFMVDDGLSISLDRIRAEVKSVLDLQSKRRLPSLAHALGMLKPAS